MFLNSVYIKLLHLYLLKLFPSSSPSVLLLQFSSFQYRCAHQKGRQIRACVTHTHTNAKQIPARLVVFRHK